MSLNNFSENQKKLNLVTQVVTQVPKIVTQVVTQLETSINTGLIPLDKKTIWISTEEARSLFNLVKTGFYKKAQREGYESKLEKGRSGKERKWLLSSLSLEAQAKYYQANTDSTLNHKDIVVHPVEQCGVEGLMPPALFNYPIDNYCYVEPGGIQAKEMLPAPLCGVTTTGPQRGVAPTLAAQATPLPHSDEARNVALARFEVVKIWDDFRENYDCNSGILSDNSSPKKVRNSENTQKIAQILILLKSIKIESSEIQSLLKVDEKTVRNRINSGDYKYEKIKSRGRGGAKYLIYVSSLEIEEQVKYYYEYYLKEPRQLTLVDCRASLAMTENGKDSSAASQNDNKDAQNDKRGSDEGIKVKKTQVNEEFITLYNAKYWPQLYKIIGKVAVGTLYRWKKLIKNNNNWQELIPSYNYKGAAELKTSLMPIEQQMILKLMLNPVKYDLGRAYRLVKTFLRLDGIPEEDIAEMSVYRRFVENYRKNNKNVWVLIRDGEKTLREDVIPSIRRDPTLVEPGQYWVADGNKLDFDVINPHTGKPCRAVMVAYSDFRTNGFCGYELMCTENMLVIASALRNSIVNMGRIPEFVQKDNGRAFRAKFFTGTKKTISLSDDELNDDEVFTGVYAQLGIRTITSKPYRGQAKKIERVFTEFTQSLPKLLPAYRGNSIAKKPAYLLMGEKWHRERKDDRVLTIEEAKILIDWWIEGYYHKQPCLHVPGMNIGEALRLGKGPGVDLQQLDELMMEHKITKIYADGIRFLNMYYWDDELMRLDDKVKIKYSLFDRSYVKVYSLRGEYICTAKAPPLCHPLVNYYGDEEDKANFDVAIRQSNRLESTTKKEASLILSKKKATKETNAERIEQKVSFNGTLIGPDLKPVEKVAKKRKTIKYTDMTQEEINAANERYYELDFKRMQAQGLYMEAQ